MALSHRIFDYAEEAFAEIESAADIVAVLRAKGINARTGVYGLPTAFEAETGSGSGPTLVILAEYDALPGIGHGCGHNIIAAAAVGAFLALATVGEELPGRILLLGTPAEEGGNGKEILARAGAFADVDAAIMVHPFGYDAADHPFIGRRIVRVRYTGVASHASSSPFMGRNALDAVALNYQAVAFLRQHMPPGDRIHGIIVAGGDRPNIVPADAELEYYLRSPAIETLKDLSQRFDEIAAGCALATGTGFEVIWDPSPYSLPIRFNGPLTARWAVRQAEIGRTVLTRAVVPSELAASTDFGNVSARIPGIHPVIQVSPPGVALHTAEFADFASGEGGDRAVNDGAGGLALTAADFLFDSDLRQAVEDDFQAAGGVLDVENYFA
nr:amidohydrolase [Cryobacterium breve]